MHLLGRLLAMVFAAGLLIGCSGTRQAPPLQGRNLWDMAALARVPAHDWGTKTGLVQEIYYEGEPLEGRPTRVFAYLARPAPVPGTAAAIPARYPGMVLVHGGGGTAFREWAAHWARRGYVALAMDLSGRDPAGRMVDGGPDQSDAIKFRDFGEAGLRDMWTYHAVSSVILAHSLLRSLPEVDPARTGLTGISWGGYLTCIVAGLDRRFGVAVPVYGCGFLGENSHWASRSLASMQPGARELWLRWFDPSQYLPGVRCPILFLNGTTDFAYPLDSYRKSYRAVPERWRHLSVNISLPHGHIWSFREVDAFVDHALGRGRTSEKALLAPGALRLGDGGVESVVRGDVAIQEVRFCYTTDSGPWQQRQWRAIPATVEGHRVTAALPGERPLVGFIHVTDARGLRTSSEHLELDR